MKRKSKLAVKFTVGFVILGVLICGVSSVIGYIQYKGEIEQQYNEQAYRCAQVAASYVDMELLEDYVEAAENFRNNPSEKAQVEAYKTSETYQNISDKIKVLREKMGANDVFLFTLNLKELDAYQEGKEEDWKPLTYLFDSYTDPQLSYTLGDIGGFNPRYRKELKSIATTGERPDNYFFSEGDYGYNTSAIWPIENNGQILAMAAVEIPMVTLQESLRQYVIYAILVTVIIIAMVLLGYMIFLYRKVIFPINLIAEKAEKFVEHHNQISEELAEIRSGDEIEYLATSILKMQKDINEYIRNLTQVTAEKERIGAELDVANHIQASMLPCIFPAFPERKEFDIFASMTPAKEVGGDFYDFFMIDDRHLAVVMADVSGKGVPAALFMVIGKTLLKDHTQPGRPLGEVFTEVNRLLCDANSEGLFITAFEGVLDLMTGKFEYVNAGHEAPYICKCGEDYETYKVRPGFVLAGIDSMCYQSGEITLKEGDKVFLYTDGVPEATNHKNELYGNERLSKILNENKELEAEPLLKKVKEDVDTFAAGAPQFDDITMLCLEYRHQMVRKEKCNMDRKELTIEATVENIERVTEFVDASLEAFACPIKAQMQINIAIDELFGNIALYAYHPETGYVNVRVEVIEEPLAVVITFIDEGIPYDPLKQEEPDVTLPAEERMAGGLGIYMVKKSMDAISYEYKEGKNILKIKKNFQENADEKQSE